MPAAAVIPAPIAYIKVVAVKKLVVGFLVLPVDGPPHGEHCWREPSFRSLRVHFVVCAVKLWDLYFEKIRVFKAGIRLNTLAWNNRIGLWFYFVGF